MSRGRRAAMPEAGYVAPQRLFDDGHRCVVRFVAERGGRPIDFDFTRLPVSDELRVSFARAFEAHTGPEGRVKAAGSARNTFALLLRFCEVLAGRARPPRSAADLSPSHLDEFLMRRSGLASSGMDVGVLRSLLVEVEGLTPTFTARCAQRVPVRRNSFTAHASYSKTEEARILRAARDTARGAAVRIRTNLDLLARWRDNDTELVGDPVRAEYCELLDHVERAGDVYALPGEQGLRRVARHGGALAVNTAVHLDWREVAAFTVLLVRLTGQNGSTIYNAPAAHHRPDGYTGPIASAQVDLVKPRRGRRAHMTSAFTDLPVWADTGARADGTVSAFDELHTPFGVYTLAHELTSSARRILGSDRLFVYWNPTSGKGFKTPDQQGLAGNWGQELMLDTDPDQDGQTAALGVSLARLRATHAAREQRPVAHTTSTLADTYLRRDRSSVVEYQRLVAEVLTAEAGKARSMGAIPQLSASDLEQAGREPGTVAARFGVSEAVLRLLVARDADTVLAACTDNLNSPHTEPGRACTASFLKCLDCPCARALPHHLPVQIAAHELLDRRRTQMTALRWAQRFAYPFGQLDELLTRAGDTAVECARAEIGPDHHALVARLFDKELDHR
ncbi:hypothetical protein [Nocardia takedensis]|uniref:hypothetical protein n=1 Tax=Nocardia takedensis TaxID=259390 RepID=UPI0012F63DD8|nr:hypothetical protein [Nocardia takedensis]